MFIAAIALTVWYTFMFLPYDDGDGMSEIQHEPWTLDAPERVV